MFVKERVTPGSTLDPESVARYLKLRPGLASSRCRRQGTTETKRQEKSCHRLPKCRQACALILALIVTAQLGFNES